MRLVQSFAAAVLLCCTTAAQAITYVGTREIDTGSVNLSITTDGTIGALTTANIVDYTIELINLDSSFTLTEANSAHLVDGQLLATATDLLFNFDTLGAVIFQAPTFGSGATFYCLQGTPSNCFSPNNFPGEAVEANGDGKYPIVERGGLKVIASVANAVPEPVSWAMMISGFALAGCAGRRRRPTGYVRA